MTHIAFLFVQSRTRQSRPGLDIELMLWLKRRTHRTSRNSGTSLKVSMPTWRSPAASSTALVSGPRLVRVQMWGTPPRFVRSQPCSPLLSASQRHRDSPSLPKWRTRTFIRVRGYEGDRLGKVCKVPTVRSSPQGIDRRSYQAVAELVHLVDT